MPILNETCGLDGPLDPSTCIKGAEGFEDTAVLYAKNDILGYNFTIPVIEGGEKIGDGVVKNIIGIRTKFTKRGFALAGNNDDKEGGGNYQGGIYTHALNFRVKNADHKYTQRIQEMNAGRIVAVVGTNNGNYRVLGRAAGLITQDGNNEIQNADTQGGYQINSLAKAKGYPDYLGIYTGTAPNQTLDEEATLSAFNDLVKPQWFAISNIVAGATETTITLSTLVSKPYVDEVRIGTKIDIRNVLGTIGTDTVNGLNNKTFVISAIVNETTFKITANTTALVYTSGGEAR
jgi:hypothetical protein